METLEEAAKKRYIEGVYVINGIDICNASKECFIEGAKWQAERMYSEKTIIDLIQYLSMNQDFNAYSSVSPETAKFFLEQFKKK
jgi:hypothetical protein